MAGVRENIEEASQRWADLELLQEHYKTFDTFLIEVIEDFMGFKCSDIQLDIGDWVSSGPQYRMVQAQRGQAKTTITAAYAVWCIIHDPKTRVLIISAGSDMATEIANWIIQIINGMEVLECLRPDRSQGDRASVSAFDIHYSLKGPEKSASVTCVGITSNLQGKRADLLIADDIESAKNSQTATQRNRLHHLTLDFTSICSNGDIVWLGTPQSVDSVYNGLPSRGTAIRIWPGRYPSAKEMPDYEGFLAPMLAERIKGNPKLQTGGGPTGDRGQVIDPILLPEDVLTKKEIDQGAAYFQLQFMLSTKLADSDRYPLKTAGIRFLGWTGETLNGPMVINHVRTEANRITLPEQYPIKDRMFRVQDASEFGAMQGWHMYVDPSGGGKNGDELAYAITGFIAGRIFLAAIGGTPGGLGEDRLDWLTAVAKKWHPRTISIEQNFGNGALAQVWRPRLRAMQVKEKVQFSEIVEVWETGQKELRIIDILEPVIGAGKLVVNEDLIAEDWAQCQRYPGDVRQTYCLFWQLARLTRDRGSLIHDDRVDALAGSARFWVEYLSIDDEKAQAAAKNDAYRKLMANPLGNGRPLPANSPIFKGYSAPNALAVHGLSTVSHIQNMKQYKGSRIGHRSYYD